jgi:hypothetical protein
MDSFDRVASAFSWVLVGLAVGYFGAHIVWALVR